MLARIAAWEPHLKATYALDPDAALAAARASEARWLKGEPLGPIDGVPSTIKENIATRGTPVPVGTAPRACSCRRRATRPPAARMRESGAVILGKTTMPDYGMLSSGLSSFHALARNPWDLTRGPGGSSAGAGAAVAAGYGPLHVGTDIGGSLRLPAAWCGIFTLKPSLGRIPIDPPYAGRCAGPMTRSVADAALLMGVLAQPDDRDTMSLPPADIAWSRLERDVRGLKIGLLLDPGAGLPVDPEIAAAVGPRRSASRPPAPRSRPIGPYFTRAMLDGMDAFWRMRSWLDFQSLPARAPRQGAALHRPLGRGRREPERRRGVPRLQPDGGDARGRGRGAPTASTSCSRRPRRSPPSPPSSPRRPTIRRGRSSTSASPSPTT